MRILIAEIRLKEKYTLNKLSQKTGISKSTLHRIENEKISPRISQLESIAKVFNMKITELYDDE